MRLQPVVCLMFVFVAARAAPPSLRAELKAAVEKLKAAPEDAELRKRIIALAAKTKAAVPEEAREHFVMGTTMQKKAKSAGDAAQAIDEYKQALLIAPWWRDAYYNLSLAAETAERFDEAEAALDLYLATKPGAADERRAKDRLYALRAQKKMKAAADESRASAAAARDREQRRAFASSLQGRWRSPNGVSVLEMTATDDSVRVTYSWSMQPGWRGPYDCVTDELRPPRLRLSCDDYAGSIKFDLTLDDAGQLAGDSDSEIHGTHIPDKARFLKGGQ